jgi:hypothetical protein
LQGLSCLKGNFHEQFLGGWAGAIPPGYPAIRAPDTQDTTALGLPRVRPPERWRGTQGPGRQGNASREARCEQLAPGHTMEMRGTCLRRAILSQHRDSSL